MQAEHPLEQCTRWFNMLATHFPNLSRSQVRTLALWSFAATLTQRIASSTSAFFLARLFDQPHNNMRQRLREFYWEAAQKPGTHRRALPVQECFAPLLDWILSLQQPKELVLALDVTLCRDRLAVLSISVVFRGSALPVAWKILPANRSEPWMPHCIALLKWLSEATPETLPAFVLCDRGLQSRELFAAIVAQGWHPVIRLTRLGFWREQGDTHWYALSNLLPGPGHYYLGQGELFKGQPHACTLVAVWEQGYEAPWLLMTDLPPQRCRKTFYGLRSWIEQGFRCLKSGAYRCEQLRVVHPERAERIWLVLAVSLLWTHAVGSHVLAAEEPVGLSEVLVEGICRVLGIDRRVFGGHRRILGVHRHGWIEVLIAALRGEPLPLPRRLFRGPRRVSGGTCEIRLRKPP